MVTCYDPEKKSELEKKQEAFVSSKRDKKGNENALKEIKEMQQYCLELSNEKIMVAKQTEQIVAAASADREVPREDKDRH